MKVVFYHADATPLWDAPPGFYQRVAAQLRENCRVYGFKSVHLTMPGHVPMGEETIEFPGLDPRHVVYNREVCFARYLRDAPPGDYLFSEPDAIIMAPFPKLKTDCAMLYRDFSGPHLSPCLRLARPAAAPLFESIRARMEGMSDELKCWHGDSLAFQSLWEELGAPVQLGKFVREGVSIELRRWQHYTKGPFVVHWKGAKKIAMLDRVP